MVPILFLPIRCLLNSLGPDERVAHMRDLKRNDPPPARNGGGVFPNTPTSRETAKSYSPT